jgi:hypothetical protein
MRRDDGAFRFGWPRYKRDLDGAWEAIEDLRNVVLDNRQRLDEIDEDRQMRLTWGQRAVGLLLAVGSVITAVHSWVG